MRRSNARNGEEVVGLMAATSSQVARGQWLDDAVLTFGMIILPRKASKKLLSARH